MAVATPPTNTNIFGQNLNILTISRLLEVDVCVSQRSTGDHVSAHSDGQNRSGSGEFFKQHGFCHVRVEIPDVQRGHRVALGSSCVLHVLFLFLRSRTVNLWLMKLFNLEIGKLLLNNMAFPLSTFSQATTFAWLKLTVSRVFWYFKIVFQIFLVFLLYFIIFIIVFSQFLCCGCLKTTTTRVKSAARSRRGTESHWSAPIYNLRTPWASA